jgi:hypothetical protein
MPLPVGGLCPHSLPHSIPRRRFPLHSALRKCQHPKAAEGLPRSLFSRVGSLDVSLCRSCPPVFVVVLPLASLHYRWRRWKRREMLGPSLLLFDARRSADVNPTPDDSSSNKLAESYDVVPTGPHLSILDELSVSEGCLPLVNSEGSMVLDYRLLVLWMTCSAPRTDESTTPSPW